jgi:Fe-S cluster assembly protein SufD
MSTEIKGLQYDAEAIRSFSQDRNEPGWFTELRLKAQALSEELPMPKPEKTRIIGWNFTDFDLKSEQRTFNSVEELPEVVQSLIGNDEKAGNVMVHYNGRKAYHVLSEELKAKGVIFTDLETALKEHGDLVQKYYFTKATKMDAHRLNAVHAALVNSGTFLYIPKNVQIEAPIQNIHYQDQSNSGLINHVIVAAEEGSSVTYVENYLSDHEMGEGVANVISEVFAGDQAHVKYGAVDNFSASITSYYSRQGHIGNYGKIEWALGQMNDGNIISENYTELVGDGSVCDTKAVSLGRGNQKQNFVNYIRHFGKGSESSMLIHGVQREAAQAIFNGITKIEHGGSKSNGDQTQRVLMLSDKARGDANPILLIDEDDVIAGHAASVGRIDPIQLYYLMSRGISEKEAERLIIHGFLEPVVRQLPVEGVQKQLVEVIEGKVY